LHGKSEVIRDTQRLPKRPRISDSFTFRSLSGCLPSTL
jgi:hypothetical protein